LTKYYITHNNYMEENNSHPLIVRWLDNVIEIPERLRTIDAIKDLTEKTRGRFSVHSYTLQELWALLGESKPIDATHIPYIDLIGTIQTRHTLLIQLMSHNRWRILCLLDMVKKWWSALETGPEWQTGIFHTGTRLALGQIAEQYIVHHDDTVEIRDLIKKQKEQQDHTAWRDRTF
jgi:hypothetical protein